MPPFDLDPTLCGDLGVTESREWIVTNGLGGFAAGTVAGTLTRRYHGLLFAARTPPIGRMLLCPKIDAELEYDGATYALGTDRWHDGTIAPQGYVHLFRFRLEGTVPVWTFACGDALLERRIWMEQDVNRSYVAHRVVRARKPVRLMLHAFANHRDLHSQTRAVDWTMNVTATHAGIRVVPFEGAMTIALRADRGSVAAEHVWYRDFDYPVERARGLEDHEDHLRVATFEAVLEENESMTIGVGDHDLPAIDSEAALGRRRERDRALLADRGRDRDPFRDCRRQSTVRGAGCVRSSVECGDAARCLVRARSPAPDEHDRGKNVRTLTAAVGTALYGGGSNSS